MRVATNVVRFYTIPFAPRGILCARCFGSSMSASAPSGE